MKVCVIGDVHGTSKFIDCYADIIKKYNDCEKIIVMGDHFDPYIPIPVEIMVERYNTFIDICKKDDRIISLFGNHDICGYIISKEITNRTPKGKDFAIIKECLLNNTKETYLAYKIGNFMFSHAGITNTWLNGIKKEHAERIFENYKGWNIEELVELTTFYDNDTSYYGDNPHQGCTWIRPSSLVKDAIPDYNQVVGHTRRKEIAKLKMPNGYTLYIVDNGDKPECLVLDI